MQLGQGDSRWDPTWGRGRGGLGRPPFGETVITAWHFERPATDEALEALEWEVLRARRGGALLAPPGSGRTHLLRVLADWINPVQWESVYLPNPIFDHEGFCRVVLGQLGEPPPAKGAVAMLERRLETMWAEGRSLLILVDDAEHLPEETLRATLELADLHAPTLVHVFAVAGSGPPPARFQPRDDFPVIRHAEPFSRDETRAYLLHRLERAGATADLRARFTDEAVAQLHRLAGNSRVHLHTLAQVLVETPAESPAEAWARFALDERGIIELGRVEETPVPEAREGGERSRLGPGGRRPLRVEPDGSPDEAEKLAG